MSVLRPWAQGPFELLVHAEMHRRAGEDFDRRMALISFDNSIEVSITTYLTLNPIQRNGIQYQREDLTNWLKNYHTKLDFFASELERRSLSEEIEKSEIIWYHDHRNEQYHGGSRGVPESRVLDEIKKTSLWVFSVLFNVPEIEQVLDDHIDQKELEDGIKPAHDKDMDRLIDAEHGVIELAGRPYYVSEALFAIDPVAYRDVGAEIKDQNKSQANDETEPIE